MLKFLAAGAFAIVVASLSPTPIAQTFTGVITDSMCPLGDHSRMRMGSTDAECAIACNGAHGSLYVLYDGKEVYTLSDQTAPEKLAGKKVRVTGELDAKTKTIKVESILEMN